MAITILIRYADDIVLIAGTETTKIPTEGSEENQERTKPQMQEDRMHGC